MKGLFFIHELMNEKTFMMSIEMEKLAFLTLLFISFACFGSEYSGTWGLPVGAESPEIQALDQDGRARDFESLSGRQGLLFVLSRSADW